MSLVSAKVRDAFNRHDPTRSREGLGNILFNLENRYTGGDIWYVNSNQTSNTETGKDWDHAVTTIDAAVNLCTASAGDIILVHPSHAENLAADSAIDIDVAGVTVIGVRRGRQMPTLTATAVAGDCKLAANNVTIANLRFVGGIDATTGVIEVTGDDCAVIDCEYRDSTGQATDILITDNAMRLLIDGFRVIGASADGGDTAIMLDECDHAEIKNCHIIGNFDLGAIQCRTTASDDIWIHDCVIKTFGSEDLGIKDLVTASTGFIGPNIHIQLADDADNLAEAVTGATFVIIGDVTVVNKAGQKSISIPWEESAEV